MKRIGKYNALLGIAGSVVGIVSLPDYRYVFFVIIGAIFIFELYSFHMKYKGMTQKKLNNLTFSLIKKAEKEIVLFGGDIS